MAEQEEEPKLDERKLFVGKLPHDIREEEIRLIFNTYGKTTDIHLMDTSKQQPGQGRVAFVSFERRKEAKAAMQVLNGVYRFREDAKDPINVSIAKPRGGPRGKSKSPSGSRSRSRSKSRDPPAHPGGYFDMMARGCGGGCGFPPPQAAFPAFPGYPFPGFGAPMFPGAPPPTMPFPGGPGPASKDRNAAGKGPHGPPGSKIYVSNLPSDVSRQALEMVFGVYGQVLDSYIMTNRSNTTRQACAFVWYSSVPEASAAIAAMDQGYEFRPGDGNLMVKQAYDKPQPPVPAGAVRERSKSPDL